MKKNVHNKELADFYGLTSQTIRNWRRTKGGEIINLKKNTLYEASVLYFKLKEAPIDNVDADAFSVLKWNIDTLRANLSLDINPLDKQMQEAFINQNKSLIEAISNIVNDLE